MIPHGSLTRAAAESAQDKPEAGAGHRVIGHMMRAGDPPSGPQAPAHRPAGGRRAEWSGVDRNGLDRDRRPGLSPTRSTPRHWHPPALLAPVHGPSMLQPLRHPIPTRHGPPTHTPYPTNVQKQLSRCQGQVQGPWVPGRARHRMQSLKMQAPDHMSRAGTRTGHLALCHWAAPGCPARIPRPKFLSQSLDEEHPNHRLRGYQALLGVLLLPP